MTETSVSLSLAFIAGLASFLSPCVFPLVPSYVTFVTGMTLDELDGTARARGRAALHAVVFVIGFALVFIALGATATAFGASLRRRLPLLQQAGGALVVLFGLYLVGALRLRAFMRERRVHVASKPAGLAGSLLVGVAFGAGWTPCVGPVLASILLYAGTKETMTRGTLLLATYALGLGIPFVIAAVGVSRFLVSAQRLRPWLRPMEIATGVVLIAVGVLLLTGQFNSLTAFLAGFGQLINLE